MNPKQLEINSRERKNFNSIFKRVAIAKRLERNGTIKLGNDTLTLLDGHMVRVEGDQPLHPIYGDPLDNPMTWDTFKDLYLLEKRKEYV